MREAPRHFCPGSGTLRLNQLRNVVDHQHVAAAGRLRQAGAARVHRLRRALELQLELPGLAALAAKVRPHEIGESAELSAEDGGGAVVRDGKLQLMVKYQHPGGQVGEDVLEARLGRFERRAVGVEHAARLFELTRHGIERFGEHAELVAAGDRSLARKVAARYRLHRLSERRQWLGEQTRLRDGHCNRDEQGHQQREAQGHDIDALQPLAR